MGGLARVGWNRRAFVRAVERQLRGDQGGWERGPGGRAALQRVVSRMFCKIFLVFAAGGAFASCSRRFTRRRALAAAG